MNIIWTFYPQNKKIASFGAMISPTPRDMQEDQEISLEHSPSISAITMAVPGRGRALRTAAELRSVCCPHIRTLITYELCDDFKGTFSPSLDGIIGS